MLYSAAAIPLHLRILSDLAERSFFMRSGGVLMHITSLPSAGGIGALGREAYEFADFLQASGFRIWQVLPVGPTGYGESPYQSSSVFAGNPLMISCRSLREENLLSYEDSEEFEPDDPEKVDYEAVRKNKMMLLRRCYQESAGKMSHQLDVFHAENPWVVDYALFTALKEHFGNVMFSAWPDRDIIRRTKSAIRKYSEMLKDEISFHVFCQFLFRRQWQNLKKYCNEHGILLFGDMPIYVAEDSADAWTNPEIFQLDRNMIPKHVAGVPPDYFSENGQLWGNPLYRWHRLRFRHYDWWVRRMKGMAEMYDMIRIDHFIGFANYYSVRHGSANAKNGKWIIGPGKNLFKVLRRELPDFPIVAEDLGCVNERVEKLLKWCNYPGMKVMLFGFDGDESNPHFPGNYTQNCVAYTGTHDNDTILGWAESAKKETMDLAMKTLGFRTREEAPDAFIHALFKSPCDTVIGPMQEILHLDNKARMNYPGTIGGNWEWRMKSGSLTLDLSMKYNLLNTDTNRR